MKPGRLPFRGGEESSRDTTATVHRAVTGKESATKKENAIDVQRYCLSTQGSTDQCMHMMTLPEG